jgi:ABC-2 type transport system permease protein|uniref:Transport permease protein n=1 Tax=candidate division WOR-3 bacterium TaxID=2052148 RepID=A0A7C3YSJ8_UNCW3
MVRNLRVIKAEIVKTAKIWLTYPIMLVFWGIFPLLWVLPFIFQGKAFVGGLSSESFKTLTGTANYLSFVLLGAIISTYIFSGLWGVGNALREETYWGTLEYMIVSPTHPMVILIGKTVVEFLYATVVVILQVLISVFVLNLRIGLSQLLPVVLVVFLLLVGFYGLAIALAGFTLLIKEVHGFVHTLEWIFYLFSPIRYPVEINPVTKTLSLLIPLTYALVAVRAIILLNKKILDLTSTIFLLGIMDIIFLIIGVFLFTYLERKTREKGTIAHY